MRRLPSCVICTNTLSAVLVQRGSTRGSPRFTAPVTAHVVSRGEKTIFKEFALLLAGENHTSGKNLIKTSCTQVLAECLT